MRERADVEGVETPIRKAWTYEAIHLVRLDRRSDRLKNCRPKALPPEAIQLSTAIFQVRQDSLSFAPGSSARHVQRLARTARKGQPLDPVTVAAFGDEWFLIDGHHRLEAYQEAGWTGPIPVQAIVSDLFGLERVNWAAGVSATENSKDRLNISEADRRDAAWRAVLQEYGSKRRIALDFDVSERTVANMREKKAALTERGAKLPALMAMGWREARFEYARADGVDEASFDAAEKRKRQLAKRLKPVLDLRPPAVLLLELLEAARPGIALELETAIAMLKEAEAD